MSETPDDRAPETREALREALAAYAHNAWTGWMIYLFSKCTEEPGNVYRIPPWAVERWKRQMGTNYCDLSEEEKASDREEADKMLALMGEAASARLATSVQTLERECDQIVLRRWVGGWTAAGYMAGKVRGGGKGATMEAALSVLLVELAALGETDR